MSGINIEGKVQYVNIETPFISLRDEFLLYYPKRELGHLNKRGGGGLVVVWGRIQGLLENERWWNSSCHHPQCLSQSTCLYTCDGYYSVVPRYSLKVEVSSDKDVTYLILGDEDVQSMVHVTCQDLLSSMHESNSAPLPGIFNLLLGKELLFLVEKRSRINDVRVAWSRVRRVCADREIIRMFSRGQLFRLDRNTRSTISTLLGEQGAAQHFNLLDGSSYASRVPGDDFTSARSFAGQPSSSASVPFNNQGANMSNLEECDEPTDKECVHFTTNND